MVAARSQPAKPRTKQQSSVNNKSPGSGTMNESEADEGKEGDDRLHFKA